MTETSATLVELLGLGYPVFFLTLAKVVAVIGVIAFIGDQFFGDDETFDD